MYICMCHAINDRQIREVVDRGAVSLRDVQAYLPVASCCGQCEDTARELIDSHVESSEAPVAV
jgi:bacterioferritin-associated ferredoxin